MRLAAGSLGFRRPTPSKLLVILMKAWKTFPGLARAAGLVQSKQKCLAGISKEITSWLSLCVTILVPEYNR